MRLNDRGSIMVGSTLLNVSSLRRDKRDVQILAMSSIMLPPFKSELDIEVRMAHLPTRD